MSKGEKFVKRNVSQTRQQRERSDITVRNQTTNKSDKAIGKVKTRTKTTGVGREDVKTKNRQLRGKHTRKTGYGRKTEF